VSQLITDINRSDYILCILGSKHFLILGWNLKIQKYPNLFPKYPMYF